MEKLDKIKIIGISLIKDEDLYIERILKNIIDFCDEIIVLDNMSQDKTFEIVKNLAQRNDKIKLFKIKDPFLSHKFIEKYADTKTWIFGVDGDEIYDFLGLKQLRKEILSGQYQDQWMIWGNVFHCIEIDLESKRAKGYLTPLARSVTKLFNFSLLKSWNQDYSQRLHGKNKIFKRGSNRYLEHKIYDLYNWDSSYFRSLHLCFVKRTSLPNKYKNPARLSPQEKYYTFPFIRNFFSNLKKRKLTFASAYKLRKYKKGEIVVKDISSFLLENNDL